jgi:MFS family permease
MEYSQKSRRGLVGGLIGGGFCAAYVTINLIAMLMFALFPFHGLHSPYAQWGWRIPFVIGAVLGLGLALYYVHKVSESEIWKTETAAKRRRPLAELLSGSSGRGLLQVLLMMTGFWITQNMITLFLPTGLLLQTLHLNGLQVTSTLLIAYSLMFFSYVFSGLIGQRIGRRRFFVIIGLLIATVGAALLYVLANVNGLSMPMIVLLACALSVLVPAPWGALLRRWPEPVGGDPLVLRLLHERAGPFHAAAAHAGGPAVRRCRDWSDRRAAGTGDQGRRLLTQRLTHLTVDYP